MNEAGPDYGIDAPNVIRNLLLAGSAALLLAAMSMFGVFRRELTMHASNVVVRFPLTSLLWPGLGLLGAACWMYIGSRYGKIAERDKLLDRIDWTGHETVLDVGCGRGLVLVGAARRLSTGLAVGVDIWQKEDLSGNRADVPLRNAELEGVRRRVRVQTADMRRLPFATGSFDVVTSRAVIHNLYSKPDRAMAIREIARVLKPGGRAVIADIRHFQEYTGVFVENGCPEPRLLDSRAGSALCALVTMGALRPNTLLVRKPIAPAAAGV